MKTTSPALIVILLLAASAFPQNAGSLFPITVDGKYGFIDGSGNTVVPPRYEAVRDPSEGLAAVMIRGRWGFIDNNGGEVLSPRFDREPGPFKQGLAPAPFEKKWAFIDRTGAVKSHFFDDARPFSEGFAAVKTETGWGYVGTMGILVIGPLYNEVSDFSDGRAFVRFKSVNWSIIDTKGEMIAKEQYFDFLPFSEGLAAVNINKKWGYIDKNAEIAIQPAYSDANKFSGGLAAVFHNCRFGYIDRSGKMVIEPQFTYAGEFSEGIAAISRKEKNYVSNDPDGKRICIRPLFIGSVGFIDQTGKEIVSPRFGFANGFSGGLARVSFATPVNKLAIEGEWGYIDKTGNFIWQPEAWKAEPQPGGE